MAGKKKKTVLREAPKKPPRAVQVQEAGPHFDSRTFLKSVGSGRSSATLQPKETVYRQGDPAGAVYHIESGKIQLTVDREHRKESVIAMLEPGEFFGEGCMAGQPFRIERAAMTRVLHEQIVISTTKTFLRPTSARRAHGSISSWTSSVSLAHRIQRRTEDPYVAAERHRPRLELAIIGRIGYAVSQSQWECSSLNSELAP